MAMSESRQAAAGEEWSDLSVEEAISQGDLISYGVVRRQACFDDRSDASTEDMASVTSIDAYSEGSTEEQPDEFVQVWEVNLGGAWARFDAGTEQLLAAAEKDGRMRVEVRARGQSYVLDIVEMVQVNSATGRRRPIRSAWMDRASLKVCSEEACNYTWAPICVGDALPERAVCAGVTTKYGAMYVGRTKYGECGAVKVKDGKVKSIRCHHYGKAGKGEVLCLLSDSVNSGWKPHSKGDPLPVGAVFTGRLYRDGEVYVARDKENWCGKLTLNQGVFESIYAWRRLCAKEGDVLVIDGPPLPREGVRTCSRHIGWVSRRRRQIGAPECSDEFYELLRQIKSGVHALSERNDLVYLIVPGLFTRRYPRYMQNTISHLRQLGLDCRVAKIDTGTTVERNAACIRDEVADIFAETGMRVLLIGHSKGGCDAVSAVSRYSDELCTKVAGVACLQAPMGGTPLADDLLAGRLAGFTLGAIRHVLGGSTVALSDLTYKRRMEELERFPFPSDAVPSLTLSSRSRRLTSPLRPLTFALERRHDGLASDGMVAAVDADLPCGSLRVHLREDWDHGGCAFPTSTPYAPQDALVNEAALTLLLTRAPQKSALGAAGDARATRAGGA